MSGRHGLKLIEAGDSDDKYGLNRVNGGLECTPFCLLSSSDFLYLVNVAVVVSFT